MFNTYAKCTGLTGSPVCGPNVIYMTNAYANCSGLTGDFTIESNVRVLNHTFANCTNLQGNGYFKTTYVNRFYNFILGRNNQNMLNLFLISNSYINSNFYQYGNRLVGAASNKDFWTLDEINNCYYNTMYNLYVYYNYIPEG